MRTLSPLSGAVSAYTIDRTQYASMTPTANTWDVTTNPLSITVSVPLGEKWMYSITYGAYVAGPNAPVYQIFVGLVFTGAFSYAAPVNEGANMPFRWVFGIGGAGDNTYFDQSGTVIIPGGITKINFAHSRDAGAVTLEDRRIMANPIYQIS